MFTIATTATAVAFATISTFMLVLVTTQPLIA